MNKKLTLTFPENMASKPIAYHLIKDFNLVVNILKAQIDEANVTGSSVLEVDGTESDINAGIEFLRIQGITVEDLHKKISFDKTKCINCGACVGNCADDGFYVDRQTTWEIHYNQEKCTNCGFCVGVCPVNAIKLEIG